VGRGYLNRPEKQAEVFIDNPFAPLTSKYGRCYRTGDIVRYLPDGNIQFVGRRDGQVKIRGFRIELKEVEAVIREFAGIKDATVQAFDDENGGKYIAAYVVSDQQVDIEALNNFILEEKPPYMVPAVTMQIDAIPLNQNQKVNKKALPKPEKSVATESQQTVQAPLNVLEQELKDMIAAIVGNDDFSITTILGHAGLTSITAIKLAIEVNKRYGITPDAKTLVKYGTLQGLENEILGALLHASPAERKETAAADSPSAIATYPLSYAQTGVYLDCLKNPTATLYNIPMKIAFPPTTDANTLADALKTLVRKHPQLTVRFGQDETGFVQHLDTEHPVEVPIRQMSEEKLAAYKDEFVRPFDLSNDVLYRFEVVVTPQHVYLLMDVHHLVFDGASQDLFLRELCRLMDGGEVEGETLSYAQYVLDEKKNEEGEHFRQARDFFRQQLSAVEAATAVRPDLPHPVQGAIGKVSAGFDIDTVNRFCRAHDITPAHLLLSAVFYSLSRFASSEELCITTISNGRSDLRIHHTTGMFVNTLAVTAKIGRQTIEEFLHEVSGNFDATLRYENYPFAQIAADYGLLPEIQYVYQLGLFEQYRCQGDPLEMESLELSVPKFPITFFIRHADGSTATAGEAPQHDGCVCINYDDGKYSAGMMQRLADAVTVTLERMMAKPEAALNSISIVSDAETQRIVRLGTGKSLDVDLSKTFANLFAEQAQRTPDAPAVVDKDSQFTYGEMNRYANALAHELIAFGVQRNDFVCVMLDRVKEFPLSVLAIHKAGAAYTPLDFEYPNERLSYMLENSESKVLITTHDVLEAKQAEGDFCTAAAKTFFIDDFMADEIVNCKSSNCKSIDLSNPDGLAYMIYTSGSTGKPKGAMLHQAGLRNFIAVVIDMEQLTAADRISGHRSFSFDAHIEDMYPVLTLGGSFHIMPAEIRKDLGAIRQFLFDHHITGGGYSTAMTCLLLNAFDDLPIRFITGGGEKMDGVYSDHIEIINVYGPTECTDDTSYYAIAPGERVGNIPIGKSVANNWNFIVDKAGHLLPQGVAGELCFAGVQVGKGYWRLPERTAQSFVACPFVQEDRWGRPVSMYHTGDLCRWNEDGQLEYLGRIDTQVKLRGFRIELGEIESKALNIEGIRQAAAEVRKIGGNEHLVLYYTVSDGSPVGEDDIRTALSNSSLADYMVPDVYMQMDVMPMTPNGKINRKLLPEPQLKRTVALEAPQGEMEELFCRIFADVLKIDEIGATDNFFEIGGTSINAIKVIVEAGKKGVQIVFNDLFNLKTPRALAQAQPQTHEPNEANGANGANESHEPQKAHGPHNALLKKNTLDAFRNGTSQPVGDVILTGATGYLGIHILYELLTAFDGQVICPIRSKSDADAAHRLKTMFFYYFGRTEALASFDRRVTVVAAEVTQPDALDKLPYDGDLRTVTVINCVANVKHFSAGNDIETVNIESVRHLVAFCLRTGARLVHISTNSVAGVSVNGHPDATVKLTERDLNIGQNIDANKYVYSKYKAEELVLDAIEHHGLNAKIMRVGNLSARQKDGEFQINFNTNNFLALLRAYVVLGMLPFEALDRRFEFSPIDEVAHAIMLLAQTPKECIVFHPNNTHRQYLSDILNGFAQAGITLQRVEPEEFEKAWEKAMDDPDLVTLLRPLVAYQASGGQQVRWIEADNTYTTQVLYRLGFQWPVTSADYVQRFIETITGFDYFSKNNLV
jgi:amino acid adenylation domain-containing protein/thioester reductase-like protein